MDFRACSYLFQLAIALQYWKLQTVKHGIPVSVYELETEVESVVPNESSQFTRLQGSPSSATHSPRSVSILKSMPIISTICNEVKISFRRTEVEHTLQLSVLITPD
jgi:hypothetical protein